MADSEWLQNPRPLRQGTVPRDEMAPPGQPEVDVPTLIPAEPTVRPAKPSAKTGQGIGPSGSSISVPTVGKDGK